MTQYSEDFLIEWAKKQSVNPDFDAKLGQMTAYLEAYRTGARTVTAETEPPKRRKRSEMPVEEVAIAAEPAKVDGG